MAGKLLLIIAVELAGQISMTGCTPGEDSAAQGLAQGAPAREGAPQLCRRTAASGMDKGSHLIGDGDPQHSPPPVSILG